MYIRLNKAKKCKKNQAVRENETKNIRCGGAVCHIFQSYQLSNDKIHGLCDLFEIGVSLYCCHFYHSLGRFGVSY